jgi:hypothetical protein
VVAAKRTSGQLSSYIFRSYEMNHSEEPAGFYSGTRNGKGIPIVQALRATSAAPYYFEPVVMHGMRSDRPSVHPH